MQQPDEQMQELLDRIERRLPDRSTRLVSMFGPRAFMVDGSMVVAVNKDHSLLVRVDAADDANLLARDEATRPEMGAGRSMGVGWMRVDGDAVVDDDTLDWWLRHAVKRFERHTQC